MARNYVDLDSLVQSFQMRFLETVLSETTRHVDIEPLVYRVTRQTTVDRKTSATAF